MRLQVCLIGCVSGSKSRFVLVNTLPEFLPSDEPFGLLPLRGIDRNPFQKAHRLCIAVLYEEPTRAQKGPCVIGLTLKTSR